LKNQKNNQNLFFNFQDSIISKKSFFFFRKNISNVKTKDLFSQQTYLSIPQYNISISKNIIKINHLELLTSSKFYFKDIVPCETEFSNKGRALFLLESGRKCYIKNDFPF